MSDLDRVHVFNTVDHLVCEISADVLAHGPVRLAHIEQKLALAVLHDQVDQVLEFAAAWLHNQALVAVANHAHDVIVLQLAQDHNFVSEGLQVVLGPLNELLLEDLDGHLLWLNCVVDRDAQVHLRGVALADLLSDVPLVHEHWVFPTRLHSITSKLK